MNSAGRLKAIFSAAVHATPSAGKKSVVAWGSILNCPSSSGDNYDEDVVTAALMALRGEIDLTGTKLAARGCPCEAYERYFAAFRSTAAPGALHNEWRGLHPRLTNDIGVALAWAEWALGHEEDEIAEDEISAIRSDVESLAKAVEQSELSPYVREFIAKQLRLIRTALGQYGIRGIAPVEQALHETYGVLAINGETLKKEFEAAPPEEKKLFAKVNETIASIAKKADQVDKVRKGAESLGALYHQLSQGWEWLSRLLS